MIDNPLTKTLICRRPFTVAITVAYLLTGSFIVGNGRARIGGADVQHLRLPLHDKAWAQFRSRRRDGADAVHGYGHSCCSGA